MMMHVVKCCNRGSLPQALLTITHAEIQSYTLNTNPNEWGIISSIWCLARPRSEDKQGYSALQEITTKSERRSYSGFECVCLTLKGGKQLSGPHMKDQPPPIALN